MKLGLRRVAVGVALTLVLAIPAWQAVAESNRVTFPEHIDEMVHYTTVTRREVEDILTTQEAMDAVKNGQPMPYGTHVVIRFHRNGEITRYFVMEKGEGWAVDYPNGRTDDWQFQWFNADKTVNLDENTARCQSCHSGQADEQFIFTYDALIAHE